MPQLIAMVIVVVGAMIYMFQTFGGTGDKIEGIAQKSSIMTEVNNIKNGIQLALRSEVIRATDSTATGKIETLEGIAEQQFFADQINNELQSASAATLDTINTYQAISFGSGNNLEITMVLPAKANAGPNARPGLFIDMSKGSLATNAGFLEKQLIADLSSLASIDAHQTAATYNTTIDIEGNLATPATAATGTDVDGKFVIYFKDLPRGMIDNN
jgi:hypothetical protein